MALTPIAELSPELSNLESRQFRAVVTLVWPYSSITRQCAYLLAEQDFRLRRRKGQVRVRFSSTSARSIAETGIGIGDEIVLDLRGAQFLENDNSVSTPGRGIDWELAYSQTLVAQVFRDGKQLTSLDLVDAAATPAPGSPVRQESVVQPVDRPSLLHRESQGWSSPAFLKRARLSDGPLLNANYDPLRENDEEPDKKRRRKSYKDWRVWTFAGRTPSPEKENQQVHNVDEDVVASPSRPSQLPRTPISPPKVHRVPQAAKPLPSARESTATEQNLAVPIVDRVEVLEIDDLSASAQPKIPDIDFVRDADYYDLYAGPDEYPPPDMTHAFGGDTEPNTEEEDNVEEEEVDAQEPSSLEPSPTEVASDEAEADEHIVKLQDGIEEISGRELVASLHGDQPHLVGSAMSNREVAFTDHIHNQGDVIELIEERQIRQHPGIEGVTINLEDATDIGMPPPDLPILQTDFPMTAIPGLLTPIGREPLSPIIKPLDSSTLPMPSPFPGERDADATSYLDHVDSNQQVREPSSDPSGIVESSFFGSSVGSANIPSFHLTHESAFTDVRFTFGMDGAGGSSYQKSSAPRSPTPPDQQALLDDTEMHAPLSAGLHSVPFQQEPLLLQQQHVVEQQTSDIFENMKDQHSLAELADADLKAAEEQFLEDLAQSPLEASAEVSVAAREQAVLLSDTEENEEDEEDNEEENAPVDVQQEVGSTLQNLVPVSGEVIPVHMGVDERHEDEVESEASEYDGERDTEEMAVDAAIEPDISARFDGQVSFLEDPVIVPPIEVGETLQAAALSDRRESPSAPPEEPEPLSTVIDLASSSESEGEETETLQKPEVQETIVDNDEQDQDHVASGEDDDDNLDHDEEMVDADIFQETPSEIHFYDESRDPEIEPEVPLSNDLLLSWNETSPIGFEAPMQSLTSPQSSAIEVQDTLDHHPDVKMESIEEDTPLELQHITSQTAEPDDDNDSVIAGPSGSLTISVPEQGSKIGELKPHAVAATGPARNTRSKTKTSLSPTKGETPAAAPSRKTTRSTKSKASTATPAPAPAPRVTASPIATRTRSTVSPAQSSPVSHYSLRSQSKVLSPAKVSFSVPAPVSQSPRRVRHGKSKSLDLLSSSPVEDPLSQHDPSRFEPIEMPDFGDGDDEVIREPPRARERSGNEASDALGVQLDTNASDPVQQVSVSETRDENEQQDERPRLSSPFQPSSETEPQPDSGASAGPVSTPAKSRKSQIFADPAASSLRRSQRTRRDPYEIPSQSIEASLAEESAEVDAEQEATDDAAVQAGEDKFTPSDSHPQYLGSDVLSSPPAVNKQDTFKASAFQPVNKHRQSEEVTQQRESVVSNQMLVTPEATQRSSTRSQSGITAQKKESLPITPSITQRTSTRLQTTPSSTNDKVKVTADIEMEDAHEPHQKSTPIPVNQTTPRRNIIATDVASPKTSPSIHSEDLSDTDDSESELVKHLPPPSIGLTTPTSYYTPLKDLPHHLNRSSSQHLSSSYPDILALVTTSTTAPKKAEKGPKHWTTTLHITDLSTYPSITTVNIFRAYNSALPVAQPGDVVLLRAFQVKSLNRRPALLSCDESGWCVWRWGKPVWGVSRRGKGKEDDGFVELRAREEVRGPEVERGRGEWEEVVRLRVWWVGGVKGEVEEREREKEGREGDGDKEEEENTEGESQGQSQGQSQSQRVLRSKGKGKGKA